ncbi:hypothetical protein GW17_00048277 [Ensete ventricosum]|nr:hypothetical protein GW17_00048277 [Ensete ventricosum]
MLVFVLICSIHYLAFCRCREKQRKEAFRLQTVNRKLNAMNKLLMEENDRLQKQVSELVYENGFMRQQLHNVSVHVVCSLFLVSTNVNKTQHLSILKRMLTTQLGNQTSFLLAIAEETLAEFLSKATGTAVDWVQMVGMKVLSTLIEVHFPYFTDNIFDASGMECT